MEENVVVNARVRIGDDGSQEGVVVMLKDRGERKLAVVRTDSGSVLWISVDKLHVVALSQQAPATTVPVEESPVVVDEQHVTEDPAGPAETPSEREAPVAEQESPESTQEAPVPTQEEPVFTQEVPVAEQEPETMEQIRAAFSSTAMPAPQFEGRVQVRADNNVVTVRETGVRVTVPEGVTEEDLAAVSQDIDRGSRLAAVGRNEDILAFNVAHLRWTAKYHGFWHHVLEIRMDGRAKILSKTINSNPVIVNIEELS